MTQLPNEFIPQITAALHVFSVNEVLQGIAEDGLRWDAVTILIQSIVTGSIFQHLVSFRAIRTCESSGPAVEPAILLVDRPLCPGDIDPVDHGYSSIRAASHGDVFNEIGDWLFQTTQMQDILAYEAFPFLDGLELLRIQDRDGDRIAGIAFLRAGMIHEIQVGIKKGVLLHGKHHVKEKRSILYILQKSIPVQRGEVDINTLRISIYEEFVRYEVETIVLRLIAFDEFIEYHLVEFHFMIPFFSFLWLKTAPGRLLCTIRAALSYLYTSSYATCLYRPLFIV